MKSSRMSLVLALLLIAGSALAQPPCNPSTYINFGAVGQSACVIVCPGSVLQVHIYGPLFPNQVPLLGIMMGCEPDGATLCDYECPFHSTGIYWLFDPTAWTYNSIEGSWDGYIYGIEPGCLCVTLTGYLAAEMGQLSAVAGDGRVTLNWNTVSETDLQSFEIYRRITGDEQEAKVGEVSATNAPEGARYSMTDATVINGIRYTYRIALVNLDGSRENTGLTVDVLPSADAGVATEYRLHQNSPNPFNPATQIRFDLVESANVLLDVFDLNGRLVASLVNGSLPAGAHTVDFNAADLPSGLYLYRLTAGKEFSATKRMLLLK